jgi:phytanoyl-CoA hydroxylase
MVNRAGLTVAQVQTFHEQGYLCLEHVLDAADLNPLIGEFRAIIDRESRKLLEQGKIDSLYEECGLETRLAKISAQSPDAFQALFFTMHTGPAMFDLIRNPKLLGIAASLVGPEIACHPNFEVRPKLVDHVPTVVPWHQDAGYMEPECDSVLVLTVWIPLVDATVDNGCLEVVPYAHKHGILRHRPMDTSFYLHIPDNFLPPIQPVLLPVSFGGVVLLTNLTPHRTAANRTNHARWSVDVRYQDAGKPTGDRTKGGFLVRSRVLPHVVVWSAEEFEKIQKSHWTGPGPLRWTADPESAFVGHALR